MCNAMYVKHWLLLTYPLTSVDLCSQVRLFLCHPNQWIRQGAVGFICALARSLNVADVHCNLMPAIEPFLRQKIIQVCVQLLRLKFFMYFYVRIHP